MSFTDLASRSFTCATAHLHTVGGALPRPRNRRMHLAPVGTHPDRIAVLYCGDSHMKDGLLISVLSLTEHCSVPLDIFILTARLSSHQRAFHPLEESDVTQIRSIVTQAHPSGTVTLMDITNLVHANPPLANIDTRFTPYCMLRLYADQIPQIPDRILYLDTDIICRRPFDRFYAQPMKDADLVAVLDYYGRWFFRQHYWHVMPEYFNSGMLLLNMAEIRRDGLFARCRESCAHKWMFMPDQSALNKLCYKRIIAPRRFNDQRRFHSDTVFQHFTTSFRLWPILHTVTVKPWEVEKVHSQLGLHEYDGILSDYERLLAARDADEEHPDDFDPNNADQAARAISQASSSTDDMGIDPVDAFDQAAASASQSNDDRPRDERNHS
jgi:lipopolysaccharide biosynthesis glycosyltransferase